MSAKVERWFPVILGLLTTVIIGQVADLSSIATFAKDLFTSTISLGSIFIGFLTATLAIIFSIDQKYVVKQLKAAKVYNKLINYFMDAIGWSFVVVALSIVGLVIDFKVQADWHLGGFAVWIFSLTTAGLSTYRITSVLSDVLKTPD